MQLPPFPRGFWWTIGLEMEAGWVKEPTAITVLGDQFWLRPGVDVDPSNASPPHRALPDISIAAADNRDGDGHLNRIRRFLSLLCWFDDRRIIESTCVGSGGPSPCRVGNAMASNLKPQYTTDMELQVDILPMVPSPEAWLGLALYREALGLNSVAYTVLGFMKVINIRYADGPSQKKYINGALPFLGGYRSAPRLAELQRLHSDVGAYLYESCRCAVAHASTQPLVNPDDTDDIARLRADVHLIQDLARHFIEYDLGVKSAATVRREHRYQTEGFEKLLPSGFVGSIISGIDVPASAVRLPSVDVRARQCAQAASLVNMRVFVDGTRDGQLRLRLGSTQPADAVELRIIVDVKHHHLGFDVINDILVQEPRTPDTASAVIGTLQLQKALLVNGILEIYEAGSGERLGRSDPTIPVNVDVRRSIENLEATIATIRSRFGD